MAGPVDARFVARWDFDPAARARRPLQPLGGAEGSNLFANDLWPSKDQRGFAKAPSGDQRIDLAQSVFRQRPGEARRRSAGGVHCPVTLPCWLQFMSSFPLGRLPADACAAYHMIRMIQSVLPPRKARKAGRGRRPVLGPAARATALLEWYDAHRRDLPWRASPGARPDPYAVWLSEIMLQQTTVATVRRYYRKFLARWPTVDALAAAPLDDVLADWAGLGYYARARNLHACAVRVVRDHAGQFPRDETALRQLPGVGPYTAAAIAAIAFDQPCVAVDGNVERVMARLHLIDIPPRQASALVRGRTQEMAPATRPGDFAQALMDLGATVCTPRAPDCPDCPLAYACKAYQQGVQDHYPVREKKVAKPNRRGAIFIVVHDGRAFLQRRPLRGLFGGMSAFPASPFTRDVEPQTQMHHAPCAARWRQIATLSHVFTHFRLEAAVFIAHIGSRHKFLEDCPSGRWVDCAQLTVEGLPTLMRNAAAAAGLIGD